MRRFLERDLGFIIIVAALVAEIPRFVGVNLAIEGVASPHGLLGTAVGFGMGIVIPLGTAFVFHIWRTTRPNTRAWRLQAVFLALFLILEMVILTPYVVAGIAGSSIRAITDVGLLGWLIRWAWGAINAIAPLAIVAGVAYSMEVRRADEVEQAEEKFRCPYCGKGGFQNGHQLGGHLAHCPVRQNGRRTRTRRSKVTS